MVSDPNRRQAANSALVAIKDRFVYSLEVRLFDLDAATTAWQRDGTPAHAELIGHIAHKLAGVAEPLGFSRVGRLARDLDRVVIEKLNAGAIAKTDADVLARAEGLMDAIETELEKAAVSKMPLNCAKTLKG